MKISIHQIDDVESIEAITRPLPKKSMQTMTDCVKSSSTVWIGLADNKVACVWGIALPTILSNRVYLWLWTTDIVKDHPFIFVRRAQMVVRDLLKEYDEVMGVVNASSATAHNSIRWLKLIGAKFSEPTGRGLIPFYIRKT